MIRAAALLLLAACGGAACAADPAGEATSPFGAPAHLARGRAGRADAVASSTEGHEVFVLIAR